jgi:hypothetical protein
VGSSCSRLVGSWLAGWGRLEAGQQRLFRSGAVQGMRGLLLLVQMQDGKRQCQHKLEDKSRSCALHCCNSWGQGS